ncbi:hypothetical protein FT663_00476 [Candidozyma haemuli var. vulneris]|uniref:Ribosomal RNA-processing protein 1 n=1 Tax=Candidozyma haemuli TaxID=45357 RepID=A0A2V1ARJ8_9ASCO|nr:hypothetical protein CXQ85_002259 [[Candida] haemuloni]KAF3993453.1 hypothetical protein FT662_00582 [[Candida] haemuloni var. vulneris]KAF3995423.1 hypothetical protein FT663_00476 [[Candida] haemuloni var. vulneris]PVH20468.1 hypothetical protein CXQ85_002259 [[Candida] haemuloni]
MSSNTNTFVRKLAHNDAAVRSAAFQALKNFLKHKESKGLDLVEFEKLWKGLYFSMWYCDKPIPQQGLAGNIGKLYSEVIPEENLKDFHEAFWLVISKEWPTIDKWRIDKYLMLIRRVIRHQLFRLEASEWQEEQLDNFLSVLHALPLSDDPKMPKALSYHIVDLFLDEIEYVIFKDFRDYNEEAEEDDEEDDEEDEEEKEEEAEDKKDSKEAADDDVAEKKKAILAKTPIKKMLVPFESTAKEAKFKPLREKCKELLADERLQEWSVVEKETSNDSDDEEWTGF